MPLNGFNIRLDGPPLAKQRVRVTKTGHAYTPERTVNYEARLAYAAQEAMAGRALLDGPLSVLVEIVMPIPESKPRRWKDAALAGQIRPTKKPDSDNFAKMLDAFNQIVWIDDSQVVDLRVMKWFGARPGFTATVTPINSHEGVFA